MADKSTVQIGGMTELLRTFKILYPELQKELSAGLREISAQIANEAVQIAIQQGFAPPGRSGRGTGALIGSIRSGATMRKGYVKDTAMNQGYSYPRRYEYENGGARSFLHPAIDQNKDKITAALAAVVEHVVARFNEGGL